jgi:hypothetical protein
LFAHRGLDGLFDDFPDLRVILGLVKVAVEGFGLGWGTQNFCLKME